MQPERSGGGQAASQDVASSYFEVEHPDEENLALPILGSSPVISGAGELKKRKRRGRSPENIFSPTDHAVDSEPKVLAPEDAGAEQKIEVRLKKNNENSKNLDCQDHGQVLWISNDDLGPDFEREEKRKRSNDKILSLAELKIQLRAKLAAEAQRLEALLEEDLRAELEATAEADLGQRTGLSSATYLCNDLADTGCRAMQVFGDRQESSFIPEPHLESTPMQGPQEQDIDWGDHADADDYWKQFEQSVEPSTATTTPGDGPDTENTSPPPEGYWQHFEYNEFADIHSLYTKRKVKKEPMDEDWGGFASSVDYWQQLEHNMNADLPPLQFERGRLREIINENEKWADHENLDDHWKQFQEPDMMEDILYPEHKITLNLRFPKGGTLKQSRNNPNRKLPRQLGEAGNYQKRRNPLQRRPQRARKKCMKRRPEKKQQCESIDTAPFDIGPGWEYEALHAGRRERRAPSPSLSPPPSRPVPSNVRASDAKPDVPPPITKTQETEIWDTIEALLAASSTSPPYADWSRACEKYFADQTGAAAAAFPNPAQFLPKAARCKEDKCVKEEWLGICRHELLTLFRGNGTFGLNWLREELLRWEPDRFARNIGRGEDKKGAREMAGEMYKLVQKLIDDYGHRW